MVKMKCAPNIINKNNNANGPGRYPCGNNEVLFFLPIWSMCPLYGPYINNTSWRIWIAAAIHPTSLTLLQLCS